MLLRVRQTLQGGAGGIIASALNHPAGRKMPIVGIWAGLRPHTGPVWVDPGGSCFVEVRADQRTEWLLEPIPLDTVPVLGKRTEGTGFGVVRHIGPEAELHFSAPDPESRPVLKVDILDENLFPKGSISSSFGTHRVPDGFLQIRSDGRWAVERPGGQE
jgi:tellurite resistance protein TerA